ncbi:MAG: hypothetical protein MI921_16890 [Cytophagales bacterium]|nr:hypothetical protein [Cytophagales bacterium]
MLSIEDCRKILEKHGEIHTDEEIREIRDILYLFAEHQIKDIEAGHYDKDKSGDKSLPEGNT